MPADGHMWLAGLLIVTASSWGRWVATGSLKVDESYPSAVAGTVLFGVLLAGWGLLVRGWAGLLVRPPESPRRLAFAGLAVAAAMLPMLSNDVYSLLAYGSLAAQGRDVYTTVGGLSQSSWYAWIGERWNEKVCVYGPTTLVAILPAAWVGARPWIALVILRVAWLVPVALVMHVSFSRLRDRPLFHGMLWLNPLWLVEGPGQLHADLLGVTAVVAGILVQLRARKDQPRSGRSAWGSAALYALAALGKYTFVFAGTWFWLSGTAPTLRARAGRLVGIAAAMLALGALFYAPFWHGTATLTEPVRALGGMNPGGSITEVAGILVQLVRGGNVPHADLPVREALELERASKAGTWLVVSLVMRVVALVVGVRALVVMLRRPPGEDRVEDRVALGTGIIVVAAITLASHRFQSWYLMAALPFFGLACTRAWRRWWVVVVGLSVSTELIHVLPTASPLVPIWGAVSNGGVVVAFLMSFRARYFAPVDARPGATAPEGP